MSSARLLCLVLLLACGSASPAQALFNPYVRVGFGGNQLKMAETNRAIASDVEWASSGGVPVSAHSVGPGYGPAVSAGLWIVPALRIGGTYGQQRSRVNHEYRDTGFLYLDDYEFRMEEVGVEAAVRVPGLAGLTFGGGTAESRGEADERFALENVHGTYYEDFTAQRKARTYSAFVGFDQTTDRGVAGFVQVGYHWRDLGKMPGSFEISDNGTDSVVTGETVPVDYSGWSVRLGFGFDLKW